MKHEHKIQYGPETVGVVVGNLFRFDQTEANEIMIETLALEQARKLGALMIETDSPAPEGRKLYCCMTLFLRMANQEGEWTVVDVDHFRETQSDAHEYAMRMEREERR